MVISFYCKNCKLDYDTDKTHIEKYFGGGKKFVSDCPKCDREQFRLITEPHNDPYYYLSKRVIINKNKFAKDLIQPGQTGFQTYYRKEWEKIQNAEKEHEDKKKKFYSEREEMYKKHRHNQDEREAVKAVFEAEEQEKYGGN